MTLDTGEAYVRRASPSAHPECAKGITKSNPDQYKQFGNNLRITVAANQGGRKYMEDRVQIESVRYPDNTINYTFVGVYDGHGGAEASEFTRNNLLRNIQRQEGFCSDDDDEFLEAIRAGFMTTHIAMLDVVNDWPRTASGYPSTAGTTCSCAFIRRGKVYSGHVGDSAIFVGTLGSDGAVIPQRLTIDHKPESEEERRRIEEAGGQVLLKSGVSRVVWTRPMKGHTGPVRRNTPCENIPFLAVARSLGDLWSYCEATQEFVVSPDPDLGVYTLSEKDVCMVLASDGLTNVLSGGSVTSLVTTLEDNFAGRAEDRDDESMVHLPVQHNHSRLLLRCAMNYWKQLRADNISVISVLFDPPRAHLSDRAPSVVENIGRRRVDFVLSDHPDAMVRICPDGTQILRTEHVALKYSGALDANFHAVNYRGPGFRTHEEEERVAAEREETERQKEAEEEEAPVEGDVLDEEANRSVCTPSPDKETILNPATSSNIGLTSPAPSSAMRNRVIRSAKRRVGLSNAPDRKAVQLLTMNGKPVPFNDDSKPLFFPDDYELKVEHRKESCGEEPEESAIELLNSSTDDSEGTDEEEESPTLRKTKIEKKGVEEKKEEDTSNMRVTRSAKKQTPTKNAIRPPRPGTARRSSARKIAEALPVTPEEPVLTRTREGMMTRSRERNSCNTRTPPPREPPATPSSRVTSAGRAAPASRKRPLRSPSGATPLVKNMCINTAAPPTPRSAPTTPLRTVDRDRDREREQRRGSQWSLNKIDRMREERERAAADEREPPAKRSRLWGFIRKLWANE